MMDTIENVAQLPFVVANHPPAYTGLEFLSAVQMLNSHSPIVGIVDNVDSKTLKIFVIDLCEQENIDVGALLDVTNDWFTNHRHSIPLSFYLARMHQSLSITSLYRSIPIKNIIRVIGPVGIFPMNRVDRTKKKKHRISELESTDTGSQQM